MVLAGNINVKSKILRNIIEYKLRIEINNTRSKWDKIKEIEKEYPKEMKRFQIQISSLNDEPVNKI